MQRFNRGEILYPTLHLSALCSLAFAQPLFDILGRNPTFFVANKVRPADIYLLVLLLSVLLPLILSGITLVVHSFNTKLGKAVRVSLIGALVSVILIQVAKRIPSIDVYEQVTLSIMVGALCAVLYAIYMPVQSFVLALSPSILVVPCLFIFFSPVSKLLFHDKALSVKNVTVKNPVPIVMVVFDEFSLVSLMDSTHTIDSVRYPNFAALAKNSYWFRNATTACTFTEKAVPAILTGRRPDTSSTSVPTIGSYPNSLFTLLAGSYDLRVYESVTNLWPEEPSGSSAQQHAFGRFVQYVLPDILVIYAHVALPRELGSSLPSISSNWGGFLPQPQPAQLGNRPGIYQFQQPGTDSSLPAGRGNAVYHRQSLFEDFLRSVRKSSTPSLSFLHSLLPHIPWEFLPSGHRYVVDTQYPEGLRDEYWDCDESVVLKSYQRYLLQVGFVDHLVGDLIHKLKSENLYDNALVIITADHGVSFRSKDFRRPLSQTNFMDLLPVPLFVKLPHQSRGIISDRNVETIDILPSIAHILDISLPFKVDGVSVFDTILTERPTKEVYGDVIHEGISLNGYEVFAKSIDEKYSSLNRQLRLFGSGGWSSQFYRIGKYDELIGKGVEEIKVQDNKNFQAWITNQDGYNSYDTRSEIALADVFGRMTEAPGGSDSMLAIVVNDTVQAVTSVYGDGTGDFSVVVPEDAFHDGQNDVDAYLIDGGAKPYSLWRSLSRQPYELIERGINGKEYIKNPRGTNIPIVEGAILGGLDSVELKSTNEVLIVGWACDFKDTVIPKSIVVFLKNKFLHVGASRGVERLDLAEGFHNNKLLKAGFDFLLSNKSIEHFEKSDIRVLAISERGVASDIDWSPEDTSRGLLRAYRLVEGEHGQSYLKSADGGRSSIGESLAGFIEVLSPLRYNVHIGCWAVEREKRIPAGSVVACLDGKSICCFSIGIYRPDIVKSYHDDKCGPSGFNYYMPESAMGLVKDVSKIRFFVLSQDETKATEISSSAVTPLASSTDLGEPTVTSVVRKCPGEYKLTEDEALAGMIVSNNGATRIRVFRDSLEGHVDIFNPDKRSVHVAGWAADIEEKRVVDSIIIFQDAMSTFIFPVQFKRPDLVKAFGHRAFLTAGFDFLLPVNAFKPIQPSSDIRFFAIGNGGKVASELVYNEDYLYHHKPGTTR